MVARYESKYPYLWDAVIVRFYHVLLEFLSKGVNMIYCNITISNIALAKGGR